MSDTSGDLGDRRRSLRGPGDFIHSVEQIVCLFLTQIRLREEPLQHDLLEPLAIADGAVDLEGVDRIDPGAEGREETRGQTGALVDGLQAERPDSANRRVCASAWAGASTIWPYRPGVR